MIPEHSNAIAKVLRHVAAAVERMSEEELNRFARELPKLIRDVRVHRGGDVASRRPLKSDHLSSVEVLERLQRAASREEGQGILAELRLTRRELVAVAHERSVHITKQDSVSRIEEKLVEAIIGSRLNSQAIRGT